jgi:hypothetical protein
MLNTHPPSAQLFGGDPAFTSPVGRKEKPVINSSIKNVFALMFSPFIDGLFL